MAEDNASIVRIAYEAFNDRALQRGAAVIADDSELVDVPSGSTFHGPEGYYDAATLLGQLGLMAEVPVGATA